MRTRLARLVLALGIFFSQSSHAQDPGMIASQQAQHVAQQKALQATLTAN